VPDDAAMSSPSTAPASAPVRRPLVVAAIMLSSFMIAIEATIVATAMPQIVRYIGGLSLYSWVFSSFLLTQTATTVLFGKLADLFGRKRVVLVGIAIFLAGSIACGLAWSMPSLIAFRLVQGLGAGAIQPVTMTIVGDLFPARERGRVQGWLASVWGLSSVVGPLAGGLIIQHMSWAWIFWINLPVGLASAALFVAFLREDLEHKRRSVDAAGAALFAAAVAALMLLLTEGGSGHWRVTLASFAVCLVAGWLFVRQERRAPDPMIAFALWSRRVMATTNSASLFAGAAMMGVTTFLPMYVQVEMGRSPLVAGFMLTAMVLGWPISSTYGARNFHRFGLRRVLIAGGALVALGAVPFVLLTAGSSPYLAGFGSLVMGFGLGFFNTAAIIIVQDSVEWAERGAATASFVFARNLGSTLGAAALGGLLNWHLASGHAGTLDDIQRALAGGASAALEASREVLGQGLSLTFWGVLAAAAATLALSLLVPPVDVSARDERA
jgi:EmrB/QacA subfamily drug resistance transporter